MAASSPKEKTKDSASTVSDAYWASDRQEPESEERGAHSPDSRDAILEQARNRILDIAEKHIRRIGYRKTTVADIASDLGASRANVYRFFPTRAAIDNAVCGRALKAQTEIAFSIARTDATASKKLVEFLNVLHQHSKRTLIEEKSIHELFVAAMNENWATMNAHSERIRAVLEAIIRQGLRSGEFQVEDADHATRGVITAFLPFFHPVLIEQRFQQAEGMAEAAQAQIRFIMRALGKSGLQSAEASEVMISA
ncbi:MULTISPECIES: TetR/AcrR family transcriptional regulator [Rhizobium]|uniref:AcrR family transcriptional regulator n=1 Tax=Rhizobium tropici TaxID=398 RepID=A0ABR6QW69_RHITR|nr:TetR family transcriptional regulator [Rhizobium tropici]MBB4240467.1 AcrR family transcriptional regulator [Rhizobium tropici]MBB5592117.1 AcrR family transcriptional regulator [Rhizobium tropici]MBB6491172.1 AcrR family transcriptional regulator [Rhizobium tropici]